MKINIQNPGSKESFGVKFNNGIRAELCLKIGLQATGIFVILLSNDSFESDCPETKFQTISLKKYLSRRPLRNSGLLHHTQFDQIRDHKHMLLWKAIHWADQRKQLIKILISCLQKLGSCFFLTYCFSSDCPERF